MPKKKKNVGISASKKSINSKSTSVTAVNVLTSTGEDAMSEIPHRINKEELFSSVSEIFSDLDPAVIYMVLSECDYRVEDAMDYLLELSTAAKGITSSLQDSGFHSVSASLVGGNQSSSVPNKIDDQSSAALSILKSCKDSEKTLLSEELTFLQYNSYRDVNLNSEIKNSEDDCVLDNQSLVWSNSSSNPVKKSSKCSQSRLRSSQQMETDSEKSGTVFAPLNLDYDKPCELAFRKSIQTKDNPLDDMDTFAYLPENRSLPEVVLDSGAVPEAAAFANMELSCIDPCQKQNVILKLTTLNGMPAQNCQGLSEFSVSGFDNSSLQDEEKQKNEVALYNDAKHSSVPDLCAGSNLRLVSSTNVDQSQQMWNSPYSVVQEYSQEPAWNLMTPAFYHQSTTHSFVTPVALSPGKWRPASDCRCLGKINSFQAVSQSYGNNSALSKAWGNKDGNQRINFSQIRHLPVGRVMRRKTPFTGHVLVLLRGVPGSGKSYLARALLEDNPGGIILSTDDYFCQKNGQYQFDPDYLPEAHKWNWKRAKEAFENRTTPIIIDNTNTQAWEMKPYVTLSQQHKYKVIFREPDTWWKFKPKELERRNIHGVSKEKIKKMLERYERCLTVSSILNSSIPDEIKTATCDEILHRKKGKECTFSYGKNEEASSSRSIELSTENKHLLEKNELENQTLLNEQRETGYEAQECNSVCRISPGDLDIYMSPRKNKMDSAPAAEIIKADLVKSEENTLLHDFVSEHSEKDNNESIKTQFEACHCPEVLTEAELIETKNINDRNSDSEKPVKPEMLNFVGDWPVEQTMGQRVKRARRLERLAIKNKEENRNISVSMSDSLKILNEDENENIELINNCKKLSLYENKKEDSPIAACMSNDNKEKDASGLLMVGDWPVQSSLEQRQHKTKNISKRSLSELKEIGSSQSHTSKNALSSVFALPGMPGGAGDDLQRENTQETDNSASETASEKKTVQNKRTRKHHKLALTFTNNLAHCKSEDELSLFNSVEEKRNECTMTESSKCSQTEPQDFALLWRLERKIIDLEDTRVLQGRVDGFIPKEMLDCPEKIPYKVSYEKSTYVEESDLVSINDSENLNILCNLFESFSLEALKDLYERCNRDIDWATGILLDSAEKLYKDDIGCLQEDDRQIPGFSSDSKEDADEGKRLPENEELFQVAITSDNIQDPKIFDLVANNESESVSDYSRVKSEMPNLLSVLLPPPTSSHFSQFASGTPLEESDEGKPIPDNVKTDAKEKNCNILSEQEQKEIPMGSEIGMSVPTTLCDDFCGSSSTLKATFEIEMDHVSLERRQDCSEMEDAVVKELPDNHIFTKRSANKDSKCDLNQEMNWSPAFSIAADNKENKVLNQNHDKNNLPAFFPAQNTVNIDWLELVLPPELAIQLSEIFGPVGVDSGSLNSEDYVVHIDLNLARQIHEKWKASIMQRKREETLIKLLGEDAMLFEKRGLPVVDSVQPQYTNFQEEKSERQAVNVLAKNSEDLLPFMDHWNVQTQKVSLRRIMSEEIALQEKQDMKRFPLMASKDCAARLKEKQLLELFPNVNPNVLIDIFKDHNYSLEQTVQFLDTVLEADPVQTVVARETVQGATFSSCSAPKCHEKKARKSKELEDILGEKVFQNFEYPEYDDFRAEAFLHQRHRQECLRKAGEAYRMGMKPVAAFYVQRSRLHEKKMREANQDAAMQIFEKVNAATLPENILDLHGLHVDEALDHLRRILEEKTEEYSQAGGKPYLFVITGRGNHSQGRVARIKPAVMKYLTSHKFRFTELKPGCLKVMLK